MGIIKELHITKFRSLEDVRAPALKDMNVFFGKNDIGKSNILKALNLFFNGQTDWNMPFRFESDYNAKAIGVKTKKKRLIKVEVTFEAPNTWSFTRGSFTVSKEWGTEGLYNTVNWNNTGYTKITSPGARGAISKFLNNIKYMYLPAVRGRDFLEYLYSLLQESLFIAQREEIRPAITALNEQIAGAAKQVEVDFKGSTGVEVGISVPENLENLYRSFEAITKLKLSETEKKDLSLARRGDGIQARFMSALLFFVAQQNNNYKYVWGFEEPENSLEYNLAKDLADKLSRDYIKRAEVFITSHSPAFIGYDSPNVQLFSVSIKKETGVTIEPSERGTDFHLKTVQEVHKLFALSIENEKNLEQIFKDYAGKKPVFICEGPCDKNILVHFWNLTHKSLRLTGVNSKGEPIFYIEIRGETNDDQPLSGSNRRLHVAQHSILRGTPRILIIEDRDTEPIKDLKRYPKIRRKRWMKKNVDCFFLRPDLVARAFGVPTQDIVDYYHRGGFVYQPEGLFADQVDGKDFYDNLNVFHSRSDSNRIEAYHVAELIKDPGSIPSEISEVLKDIEWLLSR